MWSETQTRRRFLVILPGVAAAILGRRGGPLWANGACAAHAGHAPHAVLGRRQEGHPQPRPGVDASKVVPRSELADHPHAIPVFDMVRQIPQVVDGIRCHCGCAEIPEYYSLLSCYEGDGMARHCDICQGQAQLAYTMHKQKKTLNEIRAAIDKKFG